MAITVTIAPVYPVASEAVELSATATTAASSFRWALTSVPDESALDADYLLDAASDYTDTFTPDVAGAYGLRCEGWRRVVGFASYGGDPGGDPRDDFIEQATTTIQVGEPVDMPIATIAGGHGAILRLVFHADAVRRAEFVDPTSSLARVAAATSTVVAAVAALVGVDVDSLGPDLVADANALRTAYEAHRTTTSGTPPVHAGAGDTTNATRRELAQTNAKEAARLLLNDLHDVYTAHAQATASGGTWHGTDDGVNLPVVAKASDDATATVLLCDLGWRCYQRHRSQVGAPAVHGSADTGNALGTISPLADTIAKYLDALAVQVAAVPSGESSGAVKARSRYGFR